MEEGFLDDICLLASQMYEETQRDFLDDDFTSSDGFQQEPARIANSVEPKQSLRFANPVTESDILAKIQGSVPSATRQSTKWAATIWKNWKENRSKLNAEIPLELEGITNEQLNHWLSRFIMEVRNHNGDPYTGGTLYAICSGIQRFVREERTVSQGEQVDIYKDPKFSFFRSTFDSVLKDLHQKGIGNTKKQAEVISFELEEEMWHNGLLGSDEPQKLLDTLVFGFGLNFALRSGKEHRNLRPDMIELVEPHDSISYLLYNECGSKNNAGGLKDRKLKNKSVKLFANMENTDRCIVACYKKYMSLRPESPTDVFYLQPLRKLLPNCWYKKTLCTNWSRGSLHQPLFTKNLCNTTLPKWCR